MKICCLLMIIRDIAAASYYNSNIALLRYEVVDRPVIVIVSSQLLGMCWPPLQLRDPSQNVRPNSQAGRNKQKRKAGPNPPLSRGRVHTFSSLSWPASCACNKKDETKKKRKAEGEIGKPERRFILSGNPWHQRRKKSCNGRRCSGVPSHKSCTDGYLSFCTLTVVLLFFVVLALYGTHSHTHTFLSQAHPKAFLGGSVWDGRMHAHARDTLVISVKHTVPTTAGDERTHAGGEKDAVLHLLWELPCCVVVRQITVSRVVFLRVFAFATTNHLLYYFKPNRTAHSADRTRAEKIPRLEAADRDAMPMRRSHPRTANSAQTFQNTGMSSQLNAAVHNSPWYHQ